jgi:hypothetical protein
VTILAGASWRSGSSVKILAVVDGRWQAVTILAVVDGRWQAVTILAGVDGRCLQLVGPTMDLLVNKRC